MKQSVPFAAELFVTPGLKSRGKVASPMFIPCGATTGLHEVCTGRQLNMTMGTEMFRQLTKMDSTHVIVPTPRNAGVTWSLPR